MCGVSGLHGGSISCGDNRAGRSRLEMGAMGAISGGEVMVGRAGIRNDRGGWAYSSFRHDIGVTRFV